MPSDLPLPLLSSRPRRCVIAVVLGALLLSWPAILNRYPILNPDSIGYLRYGRRVWGALLAPHSHPVFEARAEFYSLIIFALDLAGRTLWPIIFFHALLASWTLWLTTRVFAPARTIAAFFVVLVPLALFTGLSWQASWVMTDILGAVVYLAIFLLIFAPTTLSRSERIGLFALAWFGITAHQSHLVITAGLCMVLTVLALVRWKPIRGRHRQLAAISILVAASALSQTLMHGLLYGTLSLGGYHPPYLTARVIIDGPGRLYLQQNCPQQHWLLCPRAFNMPSTFDSILWSSQSIWAQDTRKERAELLAEEMPFVRASIRAYPRLQLASSYSNVVSQARSFGFQDFVTAPALTSTLDLADFPHLRDHYLRTLQSGDALPLTFARWAQKILLALSIPALLMALFRIPATHRTPFLALAAVIAFVLVANATICGAISTVDDRFGNRVIWLIPLLALLANLPRPKTPPTPAG